jgi:hypothetical protein
LNDSPDGMKSFNYYKLYWFYCLMSWCQKYYLLLIYLVAKKLGGGSVIESSKKKIIPIKTNINNSPQSQLKSKRKFINFESQTTPPTTTNVSFANNISSLISNKIDLKHYHSNYDYHSNIDDSNNNNDVINIEPEKPKIWNGEINYSASLDFSTSFSGSSFHIEGIQFEHSLPSQIIIKNKMDKQVNYLLNTLI